MPTASPEATVRSVRPLSMSATAILTPWGNEMPNVLLSSNAMSCSVAERVERSVARLL